MELGSFKIPELAARGTLYLIGAVVILFGLTRIGLPIIDGRSSQGTLPALATFLWTLLVGGGVIFIGRKADGRVLRVAAMTSLVVLLSYSWLAYSHFQLSVHLQALQKNSHAVDH